MTENSERIARLEADMEHVEEHYQNLFGEIKALRTEIKDLNSALTRWKGIGAGIAIVISLIWTVGMALFKVVKS